MHAVVRDPNFNRTAWTSQLRVVLFRMLPISLVLGIICGSDPAFIVIIASGILLSGMILIWHRAAYLDAMELYFRRQIRLGKLKCVQQPLLLTLTPSEVIEKMGEKEVRVKWDAVTVIVEGEMLYLDVLPDRTISVPASVFSSPDEHLAFVRAATEYKAAAMEQNSSIPALG